ncbi:MAG: 16S rRNA (cytosine(967)-C(5))-methyltransferase RsmB [Deltaproteobacteria bacterium]|nr:16S rRNA (cytosine(967)-C(5))-methyltransferase RsmB [Deltaproteobacteria bacterium]MBW2015619.1 16S rRNA (cytosine(967)-C(5))-methyltransferase RsmB [Deltaproteobacteria bacterium]MBW2128118.1 16S rRNA (cytosine(967)-C(5))-methyltransferase RsmB [Deltaproteobacteria bacterium]MBW2303029.1 16S rRNA (cytosine(967)-C(5))-methyltransferase RsmB [Deltaproteobacteria bacterium]
MKKKAPRNLALEILDALPPRRSTSISLVENRLLGQASLPARDRAFLMHLVQGVLRWRMRLDWIIGQVSDHPIKKIHPRILNILRIGIYQILFMDRVPDSATVNEAVEQAKAVGLGRLAPFVNGVLRQVCRTWRTLPYPDRQEDPAGFLSVYYSYPRWLVERWMDTWGEGFTEELLSAGNQIPSLTLRTNTLKADRPSLIKLLAEEGVSGVPAPYAPEGVLLPEFRGRVTELRAFKKGLFQVQDQAAQIASHLLRVKPGEWVLDVCAGLGGKATHLAQLMENQGGVIALDIHHGRLLDLQGAKRRLGLSRIFTVQADAGQAIANLFQYRFDRILVDAPCSGLGVLSRHPDGKWNKGEADILRLSTLQTRILSEAAGLLRPGGRMLYVTCTLSKEENEGVVGNFLKRKEGFTLENLRDQGPEWTRELIDEQGFFRTFPNIHGMDGFFAALFLRRR